MAGLGARTADAAEVPLLALGTDTAVPSRLRAVGDGSELSADDVPESEAVVQRDGTILLRTPAAP